MRTGTVVCTSCRETRPGRAVGGEVRPVEPECLDCGGTDFVVRGPDADPDPVHRVTCNDCRFERIVEGVHAGLDLQRTYLDEHGTRHFVGMYTL